MWHQPPSAVHLGAAGPGIYGKKIRSISPWTSAWRRMERFYIIVVLFLSKHQQTWDRAQMSRDYVWMKTHPHTRARTSSTYSSPTQTAALTVRPAGEDRRSSLRAAGLIEDAVGDRNSWGSVEFLRHSPSSARRGGKLCVCVCARVREYVCRLSEGTPLRSSLAATGCGMRRAEKTILAAWFDSQTRGRIRGRSRMEIRLPHWGLRAGRKHANEDALRRENRAGKSRIRAQRPKPPPLPTDQSAAAAIWQNKPAFTHGRGEFFHCVNGLIKKSINRGLKHLFLRY